MNNIYDLINTFFERENETSDGARGNAFEKACKVYFGLQTIETARVSPRGRKDFTKYVDGKRCCFEAKTGSGSYGYMFDGKFKNELDGNKYVIYWATLTSPIYVVPMVDFNREVQANFTRQPKYSTIEHRRGNDSKNVYSIKTINDGTSHKERDRMNTMCELYGETLEDFILNHEIKMAQRVEGVVYGPLHHNRYNRRYKHMTMVYVVINATDRQIEGIYYNRIEAEAIADSIDNAYICAHYVRQYSSIVV